MPLAALFARGLDRSEQAHKRREDAEEPDSLKALTGLEDCVLC